jgi:RNA polymerase sigma-70 factor (ECF subfamily)
MQEDPDYTLITRCQSPDEKTADAAFEELFERYRDRVFNLAVRLLGHDSDAEDIAQEAFVTVYRKVKEFRFSSRFYTWLYRVVYNLCIDHRRRAAAATGAGKGSDPEELEEVLRDPGDGPLDQVAEGEFSRRSVERALRRLSEPLRAVIVLRYIEDLQYGEIADVLGCSVGTVKSRLSRAHQFLQDTLRARG